MKLAGFTGTGTIGVILVWLGKKGAEAAVASAIPIAGWIFAGLTAALLITALVLYRIWKEKKRVLELVIKAVQTNCDQECWPPYAD